MKHTTAFLALSLAASALASNVPRQAPDCSSDPAVQAEAEKMLETYKNFGGAEDAKVGDPAYDQWLQTNDDTYNLAMMQCRDKADSGSGSSSTTDSPSTTSDTTPSTSSAAQPSTSTSATSSSSSSSTRSSGSSSSTSQTQASASASPSGRPSSGLARAQVQGYAALVAVIAALGSALVGRL